VTITTSSSGTVIPFQLKAPVEPYLKIRHAFLQSPAWQNLPALARAVYFEIADRHNGRNNGQIPYTKKDAMSAFHVSDATACRTLSLLEKGGVAIRTRRGSFDLKTREAKSSEWCLPELNGEQKGATNISPENPAGFTREPSDPLSGFTREPVRRRSKRINKEVGGANGASKDLGGAGSDPPCPSEPISPGAKKNGSSVAFQGEVVPALTAEQVERWRKAYPLVPDIMAELQACDDFYATNPERLKGREPFWVTSAWLKRENAKHNTKVQDDGRWDSF
jgi:hypothetical protein